MADADGRTGPSTTPLDLAAALDAVLERTFGDLDLAEEARRLGIGEEVLRRLRDGLVELREVASKAAGAGGPPAPGGRKS
jgi:hypothetical protein